MAVAGGKLPMLVTLQPNTQCCKAGRKMQVPLACPQEGARGLSCRRRQKRSILKTGRKQRG